MNSSLKPKELYGLVFDAVREKFKNTTLDNDKKVLSLQLSDGLYAYTKDYEDAGNKGGRRYDYIIVSDTPISKSDDAKKGVQIISTIRGECKLMMGGKLYLDYYPIFDKLDFSIPPENISVPFTYTNGKTGAIEKNIGEIIDEWRESAEKLQLDDETIQAFGRVSNMHNRLIDFYKASVRVPHMPIRALCKKTVSKDDKIGLSSFEQGTFVDFSTEEDYEAYRKKYPGTFEEQVMTEENWIDLTTSMADDCQNAIANLMVPTAFKSNFKIPKSRKIGDKVTGTGFKFGLPEAYQMYRFLTEDLKEYFGENTPVKDTADGYDAR